MTFIEFHIQQGTYTLDQQVHPYSPSRRTLLTYTLDLMLTTKKGFLEIILSTRVLDTKHNNFITKRITSFS